MNEMAELLDRQICDSEETTVIPAHYWIALAQQAQIDGDIALGICFLGKALRSFYAEGAALPTPFQPPAIPASQCAESDYLPGDIGGSETNGNGVERSDMSAEYWVKRAQDAQDAREHHAWARFVMRALEAWAREPPLDLG